MRAAGGQAHHFEFIRVTGDDLQGLGADRPGRSQDHHPPMFGGSGRGAGGGGHHLILPETG